jgi:hypothetical protein
VGVEGSMDDEMKRRSGADGEEGEMDGDRLAGWLPV